MGWPFSNQSQHSGRCTDIWQRNATFLQLITLRSKSEMILGSRHMLQAKYLLTKIGPEKADNGLTTATFSDKNTSNIAKFVATLINIDHRGQRLRRPRKRQAGMGRKCPVKRCAAENASLFPVHENASCLHAPHPVGSSNRFLICS